MNGDGLLSVIQAAQRLSCDRETVYREIRAGRLKAVVHRGRYRIRERELSRFIDSLERPVGRARRAS